MGKKKNKFNMTKIFKGFRPGLQIRYKLNMKSLEKSEVLTSLQHDIVQDTLNKCGYTKEVEIDGETKNVFTTSVSPAYIARLVDLLDRPYNDAKVNHLGHDWESPKPVAEEAKRKGKARKDLKEEGVK